MKPAHVLSAFGLFTCIGLGQTFVISSYVGGTPPVTPVDATKLPIQPAGIAVGSSGNLFFTSSDTLYQLDRNGIATRVAGGYHRHDPGDGGPAIDAQFDFASSVAAGVGGSLYISDVARVRAISPDGIITTVAGTGVRGFSGDGGPATDAQVTAAGALTTDNSGNLLFVDDSRVRKISPDGIITTVAGNGLYGFSGDGGPATNAQLNEPGSLAIDSFGNLYIGDNATLRIRRVSPDGIITTVAGAGTIGMSGDGGNAIAAQFTGVSGLAFDSAGNLYVSDSNPLSDDYDCSCIRKISPQGIVSTLVLPGLVAPRALAVDPADNLWIVASRFVFRVSPSGDTAVAAGNGDAFFSGDGGPAASAALYFPIGVAVDRVGGNLYVCDTFNHRVRSVSPAGIITTIAGNGTPSYSGDGGPATSAGLYYPVGLAVDSQGNLYIADHGNSRIRRISNTGVITTVADATVLGVNQVWSLAVDRQDNLYVPDAVHNHILKITPDGTLTTVAGNGAHGYSGDGGPAVDAQIRLTSKAALATSTDGSLYFSDDDVPAPGLGPSGSLSSPRIRGVSADGIITTVAGNGSSGYAGDGGPASQAQLGSQLNYSVALATDSAGTLYIADGDNNRIRMVSRDGIITTVAGTGVAGYTGDEGPAARAQLAGPSGLASDSAGNVYVADQFNNVVRMLEPVSAEDRKRRNPRGMVRMR
jgi:sugar lactone lactonase YvrE